MNQPKRYECATCSAIFETGKGWITKHSANCANNNYGWNFVKPEQDDNKGKGKGK